LSGIAGLILVCAVQFYVVDLLVGIALLPFLFLISGQVILPKHCRTIWVLLEPIIIDFENMREWLDESEAAQLAEIVNAPRLSGKVLERSYFKQWHEFEVVPHHFLLLLAVGVVSLGVAILILALKDTLLNGVSLIWMAWGFWSLACYLAWRWFWERRMLRSEGISLGRFYSSAGTRPGMKQLKYDFLDHERERRGGTIDSLFVDGKDDLTVIFFNLADPDQNVPASAMIFHKIVWTETNSKELKSAKRQSS
jgi:hypothetical protein